MGEKKHFHRCCIASHGEADGEADDQSTWIQNVYTSLVASTRILPYPLPFFFPTKITSVLGLLFTSEQNPWKICRGFQS